jgi:segregation and condensation protein B
MIDGRVSPEGPKKEPHNAAEALKGQTDGDGHPTQVSPDISDGSGASATAEEAAGDDQEGAIFKQERPELRMMLEAVLLVVDEPVSDVTLAQVLEQPRDAVVATLEALAREYDEEGRGFQLRTIAGGWRLYTRPECASVVERFVLDGQQARLTQAALETLSVVAYRQPVSRARVSAVRGVNVDGVMRTLVSRGLVEEAGTEPETGATLYRTTGYFLERLGIASLQELPELAQYLPEINAIDTLDDHASS